MPFAVAGTSVGGAGVTVTIPSGSNHAAVMVWFYEDGTVNAGTPSVPGGATATQIATPDLPRTGAAYAITGLSAGSATFTPPGSGGNSACVVLVFDDVDQSDPTGDSTRGDGGGEDPEDYTLNAPTLTVDTPNDDDEVAMFVGSPTELLDLTGADSSVVRAESAAAGYGGSLAAVTRARSGATTTIAATHNTAGSSAFAVVINPASGGGGGFQSAWARNSNIIL